jgi:hypothetical protein
MTTNDPRLPGLIARDTRWLVSEARQVLSDLGHSSDVLDGVALTIPDGPTVGLDNLARTVSRLPRRRWAREVRDQLTALVAVRPDEPPERSALRVKLWAKDRAEDFFTYETIEPLPGVVAVLAAQGDRVSHEFGRLDLVGDRDEAYDTALANVADLPLPRHVRRLAARRVRTSWVEHLESADAYGAARVTVLPDLLRRTGIEFPQHGLLVAVPTKHRLWLHVPVDGYVVDTATAMAWDAYRTWAAQPYPISPDVFLISPDMQATWLVRPDHEGCDLHRDAFRRLLEAVEPTPLDEAS